MSTRSYASFYKGGATHVQDIRDAVAEKYIALQAEAIRQLGDANWRIMEIALDETEEPLLLDCRNETAHVMLLHS